MMRRTTRSAAAVVALVAFALTACAADTGSSEGTSGDEIVAKVLANSARVYEDRLEFPKAAFSADLRQRIDRYRAALEAGKTKADVENVLLVGDREERAASADGEIDESVGNPYGYIRRALSWRDEGTKTIVMTEVASLEEAFAEFSANGMVEVGAAPKGLGVSRQALEKKIPFKLPLVKIEDKEILRRGGASVKIKNGSVVVDATVDFGADISFFRLKSAHLLVAGDVDSELVMQAVSDGPFEEALEKEVFHKKYKLAGVGPVSLSMDVVATVACDIKADGKLDATAGLQVEAAQFQGGVTYTKDDGTKPAFQAPTFKPRVLTPELVADGNATASCTLRPKLQVLLFDRPGPVITPVINAKLALSNPPLKAALTGAMSGRISGKLTVFGKEVGSVDHALPTIERQLWSYGN
jgi:hypothetical protein